MNQEELNRKIEELEKQIDELKHVKVEDEKGWKPEFNEKYWYFNNTYGALITNWADESDDKDNYSTGNCFQTKEEAEFAMKYKNIQRTETLSLPTWEEIWKDKMQEFRFNFIVNGFSFYCSIYGFTKTFLISCSHGKYKNSYKLVKCFTLDTKENYLFACEICRKLFLGENV